MIFNVKDYDDKISELNSNKAYAQPVYMAQRGSYTFTNDFLRGLFICQINDQTQLFHVYRDNPSLPYVVSAGYKTGSNIASLTIVDGKVNIENLNSDNPLRVFIIAL